MSQLWDPICQRCLKARVVAMEKQLGGCACRGAARGLFTRSTQDQRSLCRDARCKTAGALKLGDFSCTPDGPGKVTDKRGRLRATQRFENTFSSDVAVCFYMEQRPPVALAARGAPHQVDANFKLKGAIADMGFKAEAVTRNWRIHGLMTWNDQRRTKAKGSIHFRLEGGGARGR